LPTPINLPFHPLAGIQTSNLIRESGVGLISAATRQKGGRFVSGGPWVSITPGLYVSAVSDLARVIVVSGRTRWLRLSHVVAWASGAAKMIDDDNTTARNRSDILRTRIPEPADRFNCIAFISEFSD
jgi:hypothetical protein